MQNKSGKRVQTIISYQVCTCRADPFSGLLEPSSPRRCLCSSTPVSSVPWPWAARREQRNKTQNPFHPYTIFHLNMHELWCSNGMNSHWLATLYKPGSHRDLPLDIPWQGLHLKWTTCSTLICFLTLLIKSKISHLSSNSPIDCPSKSWHWERDCSRMKNVSGIKISRRGMYCFMLIKVFSGDDELTAEQGQ